MSAVTHYEASLPESDIVNLAVLPLNPEQLSLDVSEPVWVRETPFEGITGTRLRKTGFMEVDGYRHLIRMSEPDAFFTDDSESVVPYHFHLPGLGEVADAGAAMYLHDAIASAHPGQHTVSIATDGISIHGNSLPYNQAIRRQFTDMARDRQRIISHLAGPEIPVTITGTSMGSILTVLTAWQNLQAQGSDSVNINKLHLLSPGVVACDVPTDEVFRETSLEETKARVLMFAKFLGHMGIDAVREGIRHPKEAAGALLGIAATATTCVTKSDKAAAMAGNVLQIMEGTPWQTLKEVAEHYPIYVSTGSRDTVRELEQWHALQKLYPQNVHLQVLPGKDHAMSLDARGTAQRLTA